MKKYSIPRLVKTKGKRKLVCLTAYDVFSATMIQESSVDMILVGDTLGHVIQGRQSTLPVTLEHIIYHADIVVRNAPDRLVIADMPFGSFGVSTEETVRHCVHVMKESGAGAVKMEGTDASILESIAQLNRIGVPVMGHLGFRPQSVNVYGYKIDGKTDDDANRLIEEAQALAEAGVFAMVLECVIEEVAQKITESVPVLTIGIGSGRYTDGQVLVFHDILGMTQGRLPSFVRQYANLSEVAQQAIENWAEDVRNSQYPSDQEIYQVK